MTSDEFKAGLERLYGPRYRQAAAEAFDTTKSTIDRWANGHVMIHRAAVRLMAQLLADEDARVAQRGYERAYRQKIRRGRDHGS